jgi:hypothetical protein
MRADLNARFTDFERGFRDRMRPFLDDEDAKARRLLMQLPRQTSAGKAATENRDVEVIVFRASSHGTIF